MAYTVQSGENILEKSEIIEPFFQSGLADLIRDTCPKVEKREALSAEEFHEEYVLQNKPVILAGLTEDWIKDDAMTLDHFSQLCGDIEVTINLYDTEFLERGTISELIEKIYASKEDKPVYLQEWWFECDCPELSDIMQEPAHFHDDWFKKLLGFKNQTLWIGAKGSVTPLHQDTNCFNLNTIQLCGQKEWFLLSDKAHLNENTQLDDLEEFVQTPEFQVQSGLLERGDVLYMPHRWWHRTETLEHSASLNTPYVTEDIISEYLKGVFTVPLLMTLKKDELKQLNPMRYDVTKERVQKFAQLMGFDPEYAIHAIKTAAQRQKESQDIKKAA